VKDMREFLKLGGNRQLLESLISQLVWAAPK
jgi:hypothetical protein